jgi:hypothetical protein
VVHPQPALEEHTQWAGKGGGIHPGRTRTRAEGMLFVLPGLCQCRFWIGDDIGLPKSQFFFSNQ